MGMGFEIDTFAILAEKQLKSEHSRLDVSIWVMLFSYNAKSMLLGTIPHCSRCDWMHNEERLQSLTATGRSACHITLPNLDTLRSAPQFFACNFGHP
jgi:hypothetical protein